MPIWGNFNMNTIKIVIVCILASVAIPTLIIVLGIVNLKYTEEHSYKCKKCYHEFDIEGNELNNFRVGLSLFVKCPQCCKYSAVKTVKKKLKIK